MTAFLRNYFSRNTFFPASAKGRFLLLFFLLFFSSLSFGVIKSESSNSSVITSSKEFPIPEGFEERINFWIDVYSKYTYDQVILHDMDGFVVYDVIDLTSEKAQAMSTRERKNLLKKYEREYSHLLKSIYIKKRENKPLNSEEKRIADLVKGDYLKHADRIRFQNGQKDRFVEGLKRSGRVMYKIREVLQKEGLPEQLMYLPHVESSFNFEAYSSVGAAGIWQFMPGTGRNYMKVKYYLDERRDPFTATYAAAKLLKMKRETLGNWPLAITAYNHGLNGMMRAKETVGSSDIADIVESYRSRTFGFASKNFYAEFLAASHVAANYLKYFGELEFEKPQLYDVIPLNHYVSLNELAEHLQLPVNTLIQYNPAFKTPILSGQKHIPVGYELKVPQTKKQIYAQRYWNMPEDTLHASQIRDTSYQVQRGDALSIIARRYGVSLRALQEANNLRGTRIYYKQQLNIPNKEGAAIKTVRVSQQQQNEEPKREEFFTITVNYDENLGLYSRWAKVTPLHIRNYNNLRGGSDIQLGKTLSIPTSNVNENAFQEKRVAYHEKKESAFYAKNRVERINEIKLTSGDTVWKLCNENKIPLWLFQKHNPSLDMNSPLPLGTQVSIPVITEAVVAAKE